MEYKRERNCTNGRPPRNLTQGSFVTALDSAEKRDVSQHIYPQKSGDKSHIRLLYIDTILGT